MKKGDKEKLVRCLRAETQGFGLLATVIGFCLLATLALIVVPKPEPVLFSKSSSKRAVLHDAAPLAVVANGTTNSREFENPDPKITRKDGEDSKSENAAEENKSKWGDIKGAKKSEKDPDVRTALLTNSNRASDDTTIQKERVVNPDRSDAASAKNKRTKPLCDFSSPRTDVCEMEGDVRIHANSSLIIYVEPAHSARKRSWTIRPYARKGNEDCLQNVRKLVVRLSKDAPQCTENHNSTGLVFAIKGYTGNLFHDFTDVLVPLFTTARQFDRDVQFLVTGVLTWWVDKYRQILEALTRYPLIDFDTDGRVHCFGNVIVGLRAYEEFTIDPSLAPNNYSMVDFNRFMRATYSAGRESTTRLVGDGGGTKPRLLIIARKRVRKFTNMDEIIRTSEELGFEVVIDEVDVSDDVGKFAKIVNSCDVMMGVHGAGLTNSVFLPPGAVLIQIVPWGGLEWIANLDFGDPARSMGLKYMQYSISIEESSLIEKYPRDHVVFTNPLLIHKKGFVEVSKVFLWDQNVKLDVWRFRGVLVEALNHLKKIE